MSDDSTTLQQLKDLQAAFVAERDWGQYHSPKNLAMALNVEAGELLELYLWASEGGSPGLGEPPREKVEAELADVIICALNLANTLGVDISDAVEAKARRNAAKYPAEEVRGRAEKYTEIKGV